MKTQTIFTAVHLIKCSEFLELLRLSETLLPLRIVSNFRTNKIQIFRIIWQVSAVLTLFCGVRWVLVEGAGCEQTTHSEVLLWHGQFWCSVSASSFCLGVPMSTQVLFPFTKTGKKPFSLFLLEILGFWPTLVYVSLSSFSVRVI